jgi:hypothetical protein
MSQTEFWMSLLSNFVATLVAGTILGFLGSLYLNKKMTDSEREKNQKEKELEKAKTAYEYLKIIKTEVQDICINLEIIRDCEDKADSLIYLPLDLSYWGILQSGSDIPNLFEPIVLQVVTYFYSKASLCNHYLEKLEFAKINHNENEEVKFASKMFNHLKSLENMNYKNNLLILIDDSIHKAQIRMKALEERRRKK